MVAITKNSTGTALATAANWTPAQVPTTADDVTWLTTSIGGTCSGNFGASTLTFNGAQVAGTQTGVTHTGTMTITNGITCTNSNTVFWLAGGTTGAIAVGATTQTWTLFSTSYSPVLVQSTSANCLTGTAASKIILVGLAGGAVGNRAFYINQAAANFLGTIEVKDNAVLEIASGGAGLTGANFILGPNGTIYGYPGASRTLGAAGKTLTINGNSTLGSSGTPFTIVPNVDLGSVTRTLTVSGNTTMSGTVTGTAGVTVAGASEFTQLTFDGSSSGLSGPCVVSIGHFIVNASTLANRYQPTSIDVTNTTARFRYGGATSDFTFGSTLSGLGTISLSGNFAGDGMRFPAAPAAGNIATFAGKVQAQGVAASGFQNTKIRISELPQGLSFAGLALNASPIAAASITYDGAGQTKNTTVTVDSENNTSTAALTSGTYSLLSSGSGPIVLSGTVQRTNSSGAVTPTASARMSLTLGGTNTGDNTLSGDISEVGTNGAILGITKVDAGRWVLSGNSSHTGIHTISAGTLSAQSATALGSATSTGGVFISGSGALELAGGITLNKSVTDFTVSNATNPIQSIGTNELLTKQLTLSTTPTLTITSGNKLTLSPQGAGVIAGANGITKAGDGELELTAKANTFSGTLTVSAGTLTVGSVGNATPSPVAAAWGQASSAVLVSGTLKYNGGAGSSNRAVQMTGAAPTINASGTGALVLNSVTQDTNAKTMTLRGTNTDANTISSLIANNSGAVSLAKEDAGKWVLNGGLAHTGTTAVNGGTLRIEVGNNNTASGAVTIGASGTVELITDTLASSGASAGEVLGTGNVTVNGGTIKTRGGVTQKGQVRYGGNLTFGSGSKLYIGAAA